MDTLYETKVSEILKENQNCKLSLNPFFNSAKERNYVYLVANDKGDNSIIKFYNGSKHYEREIYALRLLDNKIKCPKIVRTGKLPDGQNWLMMTLIEGRPLSKVFDSIGHENKIKLFREIGEGLGKIHSSQVFDSFGDLDENDKGIKKDKNFINIFNKQHHSINQKISEYNFPEKDVFTEASKILKSNYEIIAKDKNACMTHRDFRPDHIMVSNDNGEWKLSGIIDFEQSLPWDKDFDFSIMYRKIFLDNKNVDYKNAFFDGYKEHCELGKEFYKKIRLCLLYESMVLCKLAVTSPDKYKGYLNDGVRLAKRLI